MTIDGLVEDRERPENTGAPVGAREVIAICDRLLGEFGRREHRFGWLRDPDGPADEWIAVDAYYPGNKLVLRWRSAPSWLDALFEQLVPRNGLRLLQIGPDEIGGDPLQTEDRLTALLSSLGPAPERARDRAPAGPGPRGGYDSTMSRAIAALGPAGPVAPVARRGASQAEAAQRAARLVAARAAASGRPPLRPYVPAPSRPATPRPRPDAAAGTQPVTAPIAVVLCIVIVLEIWVGVASLGLDHGRIVLAFGFALDACARVLGAVAADRTGDGDWAIGCALIGSPLVAVFALYQQGGPVRTEPAPLAGVMAVVACWVLVIAIAAAVVGL